MPPAKSCSSLRLHNDTGTDEGGRSEKKRYTDLCLNKLYLPGSGVDVEDELEEELEELEEEEEDEDVLPLLPLLSEVRPFTIPLPAASRKT